MGTPTPAPTPRPASRPGWRTISVAGVDLEVPQDLVGTGEQGADGAAYVAEGGGLRLTLDASPFRDRLARHAPRPGSRQGPGSAGGDAHDVVALDDDGTVLATALPGVTATVHVEAAADPDTAIRILRSIRSTTSSPGDSHDR